METNQTERLDAYLAGELQESSVRLVESEIQGDPAILEEFVLQAQMDASLKELMSDEQSGQDFAHGVMAHLQTVEKRSLAKSVLSEILDEREAAKLLHQPKAFDWWVWTKTAAVAAVALAAVVWTLQSVKLGEEKVAPRPTFLARLTADENAQWGETSLKARHGGWLEAGRLDLKSGQAEVTFGSGARVLLEGPAVFDVEQSNRGFLKRGRLAAEVPEPASGFVVNTPLMNVVDLGTQFGLKVKNSGESEVHVIHGVVEVSRTRGRSIPLVLRKGLAVVADKRSQSRLRPVVYDGEHFALPTAEDLALAMAHHLHYGFDESGGTEIDDTGVGIDGGPFDVSLLSESEHASQISPKRTAGVKKGGLVFESGDRLEVKGPSLLAGGTQPWTVMFWMKVPPKAGKKEEREIMVWESEGQSWKMRWNNDSSAGAEGALRADYGKGYATGTTDLRDGRWHHAAVVFIGAEQGEKDGDSTVLSQDQDVENFSADVATHVRLYIDGKLEALSGRQSEVATSVVTKEPGDEQHTFALGGSGSFEGWLDEFYLFETATSPAVVLELYERGAPADRNGSDGQGLR